MISSTAMNRNQHDVGTVNNIIETNDNINKDDEGSTMSTISLQDDDENEVEMEMNHERTDSSRDINFLEISHVLPMNFTNHCRQYQEKMKTLKLPSRLYPSPSNQTTTTSTVDIVFPPIFISCICV
jgi:hypothetical protein